ncbi:MAG: phosphoribosylformylglycinamidine synthase subunit PurS [archaeon GB-1867-097]|nr:phosphoribosylformylglycinamidine synthase subunit PurS [Candidatus Verstraetearchaeota archaeon]MCS7373974.1 phosphoribosylformylglycinamidine synthase subunit PurS [Candidatus Culexmicrobium thermophilum]MCS7384811.1 phosphoribosylformylglycinamidine synthase subunit PurS [Candidatus Culexmicrobium thermophilum]RLE56201.1 MAG: phosphoribosylformylglycinamidine synthase, purS protein [Candidatus Verstraetearchaeota archaeon]HDO20662.1 phosphoribosylformylglycinamidine synthase, purS protein
MVKYKVKVEVWLKDNLVDAEGKMVEESLKDLGYNVQSVRVGKSYSFNLDLSNDSLVEKVVDEICRRLLANPVKDKYFFKVMRYEE